MNILSEENNSKYSNGYTDKSFLQNQVADFEKNFYVCGPPPMMESVLDSLKDLGVAKNSIITEDFS